MASNSVYYYSSLPQLYDVMKALDPALYERALCVQLVESLDAIERGMRKTLEQTQKRRDALIQKISTRETPPSYLDGDNCTLPSHCLRSATHSCLSAFRMSQLLTDLSSEANVKSDTQQATLGKLRQKLGFEDGQLTSTFWSGGYAETALRELQGAKSQMEANGVDAGHPPVNRFDFLQQENTKRGFRLAFSDGTYRDYINEYAINDFAKSPQQRTKERDRKKYLAARFSLVEEGHFSVSATLSRVSNRNTAIAVDMHERPRRLLFRAEHCQSAPVHAQAHPRSSARGALPPAVVRGEAALRRARPTRNNRDCTPLGAAAAREDAAQARLLEHLVELTRRDALGAYDVRRPRRSLQA